MIISIMSTLSELYSFPKRRSEAEKKGLRSHQWISNPLTVKKINQRALHPLEAYYFTKIRLFSLHRFVEGLHQEADLWSTGRQFVVLKWILHFLMSVYGLHLFSHDVLPRAPILLLTL